MQPGENPPVGLILCTDKDDALARCAMEGLGNKMGSSGKFLPGG
jgi:hypothetical protein